MCRPEPQPRTGAEERDEKALVPERSPWGEKVQGWSLIRE